MENTKRVKTVTKIVTTKLTATYPSVYKFDVEDFKKLKDSFILVIGSPEGGVEITFHHPIGETDLDDDDWIGTPTGDIPSLLERKANPRAQRAKDARNSAACKLFFASKAIKEEETFTRFEPEEKDGSIVINYDDKKAELALIFKEKEAELNADFLEKSKKYTAEKRAFDLSVKGTPHVSRPEFKPSMDMPEKRSTKEIFKGSKHECLYDLREAYREKMKIHRDADSAKKAEQAILGTEYFTGSGPTGKIKQVAINDMKGKTAQEVRDHILAEILSL